MFSGRWSHPAEEEQKDLFAPVADLMVGVVFIFIILILALSLDLSTEKMVPQSTFDAKVLEIGACTTSSRSSVGSWPPNARNARPLSTRRRSLSKAAPGSLISSASCGTAASCL